MNCYIANVCIFSWSPRILTYPILPEPSIATETLEFCSEDFVFIL